MKTEHTFSILIWINASRAKDNETDIFARVTVDQKRVNISLKKKINIDSWNKSKSRAKGNSQEARKLNLYLDQVQAQLFDCYQELKLKDALITSQLIKSKYLGTDITYQSLQQLIDYHNLKSVNKLHKDTMRHYKTTQRYLINFLKEEFNSPDMYLNNLNYSFIVNFENFLRAYQPTDHHSKIGNNTIMKHIQRLRKMVTMAFHNEWIEKDPFVKFKSTFEKKSREFLSSEELQSIENYTTNFERLDLVKDLFIFSSYTGLSYIDIMQLKNDNILKGIDGNDWVITKRQKTGTNVKVPILETAQLIQLNQKIKRTQDCLNELRQEVKLNSFSSSKKEIHFFKYQKPYIKGSLKFYVSLNSYLLEKPEGSKAEQRKFVNLQLSQITTEYCKYIDFVNYYKLEESKRDETYFLRGVEQFELFIDNTTIFEDPEFCTLRDHLASKIIANDLLIKFYTNELETFKKNISNPPIQEVQMLKEPEMNWTASNTDLAELGLSLIAFGAINNGNMDMIKIVEGCGKIFGIDLGNIYNIYAQIKNRKKDPTKFLDKLKFALIKKLETDL